MSSVAVLWFGAGRVDAGQMQIGSLTAFLMYLMQILMSVMMATFMAMMVPRAAICADRVAEVLDTETSVVPPAEPVQDVGVAQPACLRLDQFQQVCLQRLAGLGGPNLESGNGALGDISYVNGSHASILLAVQA